MVEGILNEPCEFQGEVVGGISIIDPNVPDNKTTSLNKFKQIQAIGLTNGEEVLTYNDIKEAVYRESKDVYVFDTAENFLRWIDGEFVREDGVVPSDLRLGDDILIKETNVPDYWYSSDNQPITIDNFTEYEGKQDFYTKEESDARYVSLTEAQNIKGEKIFEGGAKLKSISPMAEEFINLGVNLSYVVFDDKRHYMIGGKSELLYFYDAYSKELINSINLGFATNRIFVDGDYLLIRNGKKLQKLNLDTFEISDEVIDFTGKFSGYLINVSLNSDDNFIYITGFNRKGTICYNKNTKEFIELTNENYYLTHNVILYNNRLYFFADGTTTIFNPLTNSIENQYSNNVSPAGGIAGNIIMDNNIVYMHNNKILYKYDLINNIWLENIEFPEEVSRIFVYNNYIYAITGTSKLYIFNYDLTEQYLVIDSVNLNNYTNFILYNGNVYFVKIISTTTIIYKLLIETISDFVSKDYLNSTFMPVNSDIKDLQEQVNTKQNTLINGNNISIVNNKISVSPTRYAIMNTNTYYSGDIHYNKICFNDENGDIYGFVDNTGIYVNNNLIISVDYSINVEFDAFVYYNNKLYVGGRTSANIYVYDLTTNSLETTLQIPIGICSFFDNYENNLYFGGYGDSEKRLVKLDVSTNTFTVSEKTYGENNLLRGSLARNGDFLIFSSNNEVWRTTSSSNGILENTQQHYLNTDDSLIFYKPYIAFDPYGLYFIIGTNKGILKININMKYITFMGTIEITFDKYRNIIPLTDFYNDSSKRKVALYSSSGYVFEYDAVNDIYTETFISNFNITNTGGSDGMIIYNKPPKDKYNYLYTPNLLEYNLTMVSDVIPYITIYETDWKTNDDAFMVNNGYIYKADITVCGVNSNTFASVSFGAKEALSGNYAPIVITSDSMITIYSKVMEQIEVGIKLSREVTI